MAKKWGLVAALVLLVALFFFSGAAQFLDLSSLKALRGEFAQWQLAHPGLFLAAFFLCYVAVTALSLPGAVILTLGAGAFFGLFQGFLVASFASTLGACCAFLCARFIARDWVAQRFSSSLKKIDQGIAREGALYLFSLRLVPLFPFFLINLVMGLTNMPLRRFYWVSQLGMVPGTLVYVNAGRSLSEIDGLSGILSPGLIASFVMLGIFPLLAKRIVEALKRRRVYKGWSRPQRFDRNLLVIGGGAAGLVSAYIGATVRAKVTLVEAGAMGGDCLNTGCVPSKALIKAASVVHQYRRAERYGLQVGGSVDLPRVMERVRRAIADIEPHDSVERYTGLGVDVVQGYARLVDPWTVEIRRQNGELQRLTAASVVIASGAEPVVPPLPGLETAPFVTSETLWQRLESYAKAPERVVVLGGGPIGCELSQALQRLGSAVVQVEMAPRLLLREDAEVSAFAEHCLRREGVEVLTNTPALRCEFNDAEHCLVVDDSVAGERTIPFDLLVCAVGRRPRLRGFGLEELGVPAHSALETNQYLQTRFPHIYAAGDVAGPYQFTHVAAHQAWYASVNALFGRFKRFAVDYRVIPAVTYLDPEIARVGLNEAEAGEQGIAYDVTRYDIADLDRALCDDRAEGFVKILTPPGRDRILGVTIVGANAGELLAEYVLAMKHGLGLGKVLATIHSYPTYSEANKYAAGEWRKARQPERLLGWLQRYFSWRLK